MVSYLAIAEFFHVLFAAMWVGTSVYGEAVAFRIWRRARTVGEMRSWLAILRPTGIFQTVNGILVVITGFIYMFLLWGTDFAAIWATPDGMLVLISLGLVLLALAIGFAIITRTSIRLGRSPMPEDPAASIPAESLALAEKTRRGLTTNTVIIVIVLFLMVVAAYGGF